MLRTLQVLTWAVVSSAALAHTAHATPIQLTVHPGELITVDGTRIRHPTQPTLSLSLSELMLGFNSILSIQAGGTSPASMNASQDGMSLVVDMPVSEITGNYERSPSAFDTTSVSAVGGISFVTVPPSRWRPLANGSLTLSNFRLDMPGGGVYADVQGGNELGHLTGVRMFDMVGNLQANMTVREQNDYTGGCQFLYCPIDALSLQMPATTLSLTPEGFTVFSKALGLTITSLGESALEGAAPNFGTLSISPVPEPSIWLTMGVGLVGIGLMHQRRRATT